MNRPILQLDNFVLGMHTKPALVRSGSRYARDVRNLRIDSDGFLRLRSGVEGVGSDGADITGVAASATHLFVLRQGGRLFLRNEDDVENETEILGVTGLSGRISIVSEFRDYVIITSEGEDQGFWIDLREGKELRGHPLGIDKPVDDSFTVAFPEISLADDETGPNILVAYAITYVRQFESGLGEVPPDDLFNGMESEISQAQSLILTRPIIDGQKSSLYRTVTFDFNVGVLDLQITGVNVYRSVALIEDSSPDFDRIVSLVEDEDEGLDLLTLDFRKVQYIERDNLDLRFHDGIVAHPIEDEEIDFFALNFEDIRAGIDLDDDEIGGYVPYYFKADPANPLEGVDDDNRVAYEWVQQEKFERNTNNRMPSSVKQIHHYNNRVFAAAGDRLVYSDIRDGNLFVWAFPEINDIRTEKRVDFCAEHREVLLFGAKDGLFRLTGTDRYNFQVDELSPVGPVDPFAWGKLKDFLGYVTENGLYLTDNVNVEFVSDEVLDRFFENHVARRGSVLFFADNSILFSVGLLQSGFTAIQDYLFLYDDKHWVRWDGIDVEQFASLVTSDTDHFVADGTGILKHIDWHNVNNSDDELEWYWESNLISGLEIGDANFMKRFGELRVAAQEKDMTLTYWLDDKGANVVDFRTRDSVFERIVPLNRWARRFRFRISGKGPVNLRGLRLEGERK